MQWGCVVTGLFASLTFGFWKCEVAVHEQCCGCYLDQHRCVRCGAQACVLSAGFWVTLSFVFYGLVLREMQRMVNSAAKANEGTNMRLRGLNFIHNYSGGAAPTPEAGSSRGSCSKPVACSARQSADADAICLCMMLALPPPAALCWDPVALPQCLKACLFLQLLLGVCSR